MNIGGDPNDKYYRYKRRAIEVRILLRKGHLTQIMNLDGLAKDLRVNPTEITSFIRKKLCVAVTGDEVHGAWFPHQLEVVIEKFIAERVLCKNCKLPELKDGHCSACGDTTSDKKDKPEILLDKPKTDRKLDKEIARMIKTLEKREPSDERDQLIEECWRIDNADDWSQLKTKWSL